MSQGTCKYQFRDSTSCKETAGKDSVYCVWHDPSLDRKGIELKKHLEDAHKSGKRLEGFNLHNASLDGVNLTYANLTDVNFRRASLRGAHLFGSDLTGANLFKANLDNANFKQTVLIDAELLGTKFGNASFENVYWGPGYKVKNELEADNASDEGDLDKASEKYYEAMEIYRNVKNNLQSRGLSHYAGKFFYREMIMQRRLMPAWSPERFWSIFMDFSTGYGEKPYRIITLSTITITIFALIFGFLGLTHFSGVSTDSFSLSLSVADNLLILYNSFYYSVVTFTTLGYGDYSPEGVGKILSALEAYMGYFLLALFVITIYKRYMER
ncbi:MAG: pentapeptide repeat-containing protein [Nitrospinota bacterium]|nr:pentapeptide repeat-containing protein [Nitrospinota bacterium]